MTEEQTFLQAISVAPNDDAPRLIYADWLKERGDPRGEFIRIQCCLASLPENDPQRPALQRREDKLLNQHRASWEGPLRQICKNVEVIFQRGLPETLKISSANFLAHADQLFALAPIRGIDLGFVCQGDTAAIAASSHLKSLTTLGMKCSSIGPKEVQALAASPHLSNLVTLELGYNTLENEGAEAPITSTTAAAASPPLSATASPMPITPEV